MTDVGEIVGDKNISFSGSFSLSLTGLDGLTTRSYEGTTPATMYTAAVGLVLVTLTVSLVVMMFRAAKERLSVVTRLRNHMQNQPYVLTRENLSLTPLAGIDLGFQATPGRQSNKNKMAPTGVEPSASQPYWLNIQATTTTPPSDLVEHVEERPKTITTPQEMDRTGLNESDLEFTQETEIATDSPETLWSHYVTIEEVEEPDNPEPPLYYSTTAEEFLADLDEEDVILCMDGGEIFAAYKPMHSDAVRAAYKQAATRRQLDDQPQSMTAYKQVDRKVKPVPAVYPEDAKVERRFPEDPLASLKPLPVHPPSFQPDGGRLSQQRLDEMELNPTGYLWPEELKLFQHILQLHQNHFVWEDHERGSFSEEYFTPYIIPLVPHVPWAFGNIPIPPALKERVVQLLREKIAAGVYEPSQSSYRSRWFCVLKKSGKLRIVHDLQPLNKVTIRDAGLPPNLDEFVEPFAGRQCYTVFDLYWG